METKYYSGKSSSSNFGSFPAMNNYLEQLQEIQSISNHYDHIIFKSCAQGQFHLVKKMIDKGIDIEQKDRFNYTPIMHAAINGHRGVVSLLIDHHARITYPLLSLIKSKIEKIEQNVRKGQENPSILASWKIFLEYLIQEGKKQ
jgi:ankyrin repeat protein